MRWLWLWIVLISCSSVEAQERTYRVVFYNVENLFDTRNDSLTADDEFTPGGRKHWTEEKYITKLLHIAEVLNRLGGKEAPLLIGLAEVENRKVVEDLLHKAIWNAGQYGIFHEDSPDVRGIDVALLYRKDLFLPVQADFLRVDSSWHTRDILYTAGKVGKDTLHVFVCHFPSMSGGEAESEWKRIRAAEVVRGKVNELQARYDDPAILIMGDLNGKADTEAQKRLGVISGTEERIMPEKLYNPGYYLLRKNYGSFRYQGVWQTLDHFIVSGSLISGKLSLQANSRTEIFSAPFLLEEDKKYFGYRPWATYRGLRYTGGYSDHLPVYLEIKCRE